jgi:hypothetical protein
MTNRIRVSNCLVAISVLGLAMAGPASALTPPVLKISDGTNTIVIDSTGIANATITGSVTTTSSAFSSGSITWSGTIGVFQIQTLTGESKPLLPMPTIDVGVNGGSVQTTGAGTLTVTWSDTGFTNGTPVTSLSGATGLIGGGSVTYTAYVDGTNALYGMGTLSGTQTATTSSTNGSTVTSGVGPATPTFSMTEVIQLALPGGGYSTFDDQFTVTSSPVSLACPAGGTQNTIYSGNLTASGGTAPYTYAISSGSLPPGLSISPATGAITGTPTTSGSYSFTASAVDAKNDTDTASCSLSISAVSNTPTTPLSLSCPAGTGVAGVKYSDLLTLTASGGTAPYTYSETGSLDGLLLNTSTGVISGTPTSSGTFKFTGSVTDSTKGGALTATSSCSIVVSTPPPTLTVSCPASTGSVGVPYSSTPAVNGGSAPYSYSLSGYLPNGLSFNPSTGAITGTPTTTGTYNFSVSVRDANGNNASCNNGYNGGSSSGCVITIGCSGTGTISGYTYDDLNGSKSYNNGDKALSGVTVTLSLNGRTVASTTTNSSGYYSFGNLASGNYVVSVPNSVISGSESADTPVSINVNLYSNNNSYGQSTCQTASSNNDFGYVGSSTISGKCYSSDNYGNTSCIPGQQVTVSGKDCFGNNVNKSVTTDQNGNYSCSGLYPGNYTVTAPSQWNSQGYNHNIQTNSSYNVSCQSGGQQANLNFCYSGGGGW